MNQNTLIVFISFLLLAVLLLLLVGDAREKSKRIRVLVDLSGNPDEQELTDRLKPFLQKMTDDSPLLFILNDEPQLQPGEPGGLYRAILQIQVLSRPGAKNELAVYPAERNRVHLLLASPDALADEPDLVNQVISSILQMVQDKQPA